MAVSGYSNVTGIWLFLFYHTGWFALWGILLALLGVMVYFLVHKKN